MKHKDRLDLWQERLLAQEDAYLPELERMDGRESLFKGDRALRDLRDGSDRLSVASKTEAVHVRNIVAECVEAQVDANIPQPKVTALRQEDEGLADKIESMLRNELDRMPFELMNDMMARTVPIQGGGMWFIEWDNTQRTHKTVGEICISTLHPKQVIPQDGVYDKIEDMDYIIVKLPQTKEYISRRYGVSVDDETESEPQAKGSDGDDISADMVTQYIAYYRNDSGGIGLFSWVNDTILDDLDGLSRQEGYDADQMRRDGKRRTASRWERRPTMATRPMRLNPVNKSACGYCGSTSFEAVSEDYEEVYVPIMRDGEPIPGATNQLTDTGEMGEDGLPVAAVVSSPTRIPYYKPDVYPVILQRNVSTYGRFLGESDVDKIADMQNTTNILHGNIIDKLLTGGSYMLLPNRASIKVDGDRKKVIRIDRVDERSMFDTISMEESHCSGYGVSEASVRRSASGGGNYR